MWCKSVQKSFPYVVLWIISTFVFVAPLVIKPLPYRRYSKCHCKIYNGGTNCCEIRMNDSIKFTSTSDIPERYDHDRGSFLRLLATTGLSLATSVFLSSTVAIASATETKDYLFQRETNEFRYQFQVPVDFTGPSQKPVKTHLDEVNFKSTTIAGYEIGITIDPVRISSLAEFGTPEEVAAKVVLAEVNRDGVLDVQLVEDPLSGTITLDDGNTTTTYYQLNYRSNGKRGTKRFIAKFYVINGKLYAFTAQCKEDTYDAIKQDIKNTASSFRVI